MCNSSPNNRLNITIEVLKPYDRLDVYASQFFFYFPTRGTIDTCFYRHMHVLIAKCTFQHYPDYQSILFRFSFCLTLVLFYIQFDGNGTAHIFIVPINEKKKKKEYSNRDHFFSLITKMVLDILLHSRRDYYIFMIC